jgi:hypothetical protein
MTTTLFDLVSAIQDEARSDAEVVATVTHLLNASRMTLRGGGRLVVELTDEAAEAA